jgi:ELWxxDGT repeat protein
MKKLITLFLIFISINSFSQNPLLLKDVSPGNNSATIQHIVKTSNYTFFNENDGGASTGRSLYRTDGTPGGTIKLNLTYPTYLSTKADKLTALGDKVIFAGDNFAPGYGEIWASDGTQAGTIAVERFQPTINNRDPVYELADERVCLLWSGRYQ